MPQLSNLSTKTYQNLGRTLSSSLLAGSLLLTQAHAADQPNVDNSGADQPNRDGAPISGPDGNNGGSGTLASATNGSIRNTSATAVSAKSNGGNGGGGGDGVGFLSPPYIPVPPFGVPLPGFGGDGGNGGNGSIATVTNSGNLTTSGAANHGILAESIAGNGGDGGDSILILGLYGEGGDGGLGGEGGSVTVVNSGTILTTGPQAHGILGQSRGGIAGYAGDSDGFGLIAVGGDGGSTGNGGSVLVTNTNMITTRGLGSIGIFAQSVGGFSGAGGSSSGIFSFGGSSDSAGDASTAEVNNSGAITTNENDAFGILVQSVGGGGGNGGSSFGQLSVGGSGGAGGDGKTATLNNTAGGNVTTYGDRSTALFAQSVGGGGGNGGDAIAVGVAVAVGVGGKGEGGGDGGVVNVNTANTASTPGTTVVTHGFKSHGLQAQSIGGGGGNGGYAFAAAAGPKFSAAVAVGGNGAGGGDGKAVNAKYNGSIETGGYAARGIFAQSVGGGGGDGGSSIALAASDGAAVTVSVGGKGSGGGDAGAVDVTTYSDITTIGNSAHGIEAQSVGGGGGNGGFAVAVAVGGKFGASVGLGGDGAGGGEGQTVTVDNHGIINTGGNFAHGIKAQSVGGGGGDGGFSVAGALSAGPAGVAVSIGGGGGTGNISRKVTVMSAGEIHTTGVGSLGIYSQSIGGGGGSGGFAASLAASKTGGALAVGLGGDGGSGGHGASVEVESSSDITTTKTLSIGILAQSVGGGGGNGGAGLSGAGGRFAGSVSVGGSGKAGGTGGDVVLKSSGSVTTDAALAYGLQAQSVGGGGGNGGFAIGVGISAGSSDKGAALAVAVGGNAGDGSTGGIVTLTNDGNVTTGGVGSHAIVAQSLGGGGGNGGFAGAFTGSNGPSASISVGVGGSGGTGGIAKKVTVNSLSGKIETKKEGANGIHAQSVGGGGGDGGFALSGAFGSGDKSLNLGVSIGGSGGGDEDDATDDALKVATGTGGEVEVNNHSEIVTAGYYTSGIFAQSIGGGGGTGGFAATLTGSKSTEAKQLSVSIGGSGGAGNDAKQVTVMNYNDITTTGKIFARGITAQSIGGGGGDGGLSFSGSLAASDSKQMALSIGGSGGVGGDGGVVKVTHDVGTIATQGLFSHGIFAQSVGGGGGSGGNAISGMLGLGGEGTNVNLAATIGGSGGAGGIGKLVEVVNNGTINTTGLVSSAIYAQSIGGGGGSGGSSFTGIVGVASSSSQAGKSRTVNLSVSVGGNGGTGNFGGKVDIMNTGNIKTTDAASHGIFAQSVGGGGGDGGRVNTISMIVGSKQSDGSTDTQKRNFNLSASIGGDGAEASDGGIVEVDNQGVIETTADNSMGIFAQSIGGGGGTGGSGIIGSKEILPVPLEVPIAIKKGKVDKIRDIQISVGGEGGSSGDGKQVTVTNSQKITTRGHDSHGIFAQSVGGGGGVGGTSVIGATGKIGLGGKGGSSGNGGNVEVFHAGGVIETFEASSYGIFAQSIGGGGGVAGNVDRVLSPKEDGSGTAGLPPLNLGIGVALGQGGGNGGNGGTVKVDSVGRIITHELGAHGIFAQSVGGGGGILGTLGNEKLTALDFTDTDTGNDIARLGGHIGSMGDAGNGGEVIVSHHGDITTSAESTNGILAQSAGGTGLGKTVKIETDGEIHATGAGSYGILAQSIGLAGNDDITIDVMGGMVVGGAGTGAGIRFDDGKTNRLTNRGIVMNIDGIDGVAVYGAEGSETIDNYGTVAGNLVLGGGVNAFNNKIGGTFAAGSHLDLGGPAEVLLNEGVLAPGGRSNVLTTALNGTLDQRASGAYAVDLDFGSPDPNTDGGNTDFLDATGAASLAGAVEITLVNPNLIPVGTYSKTVLNADLGVTNNGLMLTTAPSAVISYDLTYPSANTVGIDYTVDFSPDGANLGQNLEEVGNYFNQIQAAGSSPALGDTVIKMLYDPTFEEYRKTLSQMGPDFYGELQANAIHRGERFGHLLASGGGHRIVEDDYSMWFNYGTESGKHDSYLDYKRIDNSSDVFSVGFEKKIKENWMVGIGFTVEDHRSVGYGGQWQSEGDSRQLGFVLKHCQSNTEYAATLAYGWGKSDIERTGLVSSAFMANANRDLETFSGMLQVSHTFTTGEGYIRPTAGVGFTHLMADHAMETGAGALNLQLQEYDETHVWARLGVGLGRTFTLESGNRINLHGDLGFQYYLSDGQTTARARLEGAPAGIDPMAVDIDLNEAHGYGSIGVEWMNRNGVSVGLDYSTILDSHSSVNRWDFSVTIPF